MISLIIPIYNENAKIEPCMENLRPFLTDMEILFADGGSTDGTPEKIDSAFTLVSCPKGRANQMNHAAKQATGDIFWFSHCDSILPPTAAEEIQAAVDSGARFGCFHIAFDYDGPFMGCNTFFSNRRAKKRHIAFGDQGIFMTRELFEECGGFPALPIMEDYELSLRMKSRGVRLHVLPSRILTSGRRYRGRFPLWTMWQMFWLRRLYRAGADINEIARRYRDIR